MNDSLVRSIRWAAWIMVVERNCVVCDVKFTTHEREVKRGKGRCCSLSCAASLSSVNRNQKGSYNNNWRGGLSDNTGRKRRYREKNPEKHRAHLLLRDAVRKGILVKGACSLCGSSEKIEGHHPDYTKPLYIIWLCKKHHLEAHNGRFK